MKKTDIITLITLFIFAFSSTVLNAAGIKERLAERLPAVNKMKEKGLIGENNKGYLEARQELNEENKKILEAENTDRKKIYEMLAKKTGQAVEVISTRRALQIAEKTKAGVWLQKPDGTWYKK